MSPRIVAGDSLSEWKLVRKIGRGATGTVFEATGPRLAQPVAVKVLALEVEPGGAGASAFEREAKVLASVKHPHVVALLDAGTAQGAHYLVMELVTGETLAARIARGRVPPGEAARTGNELLSALAAIHRAGVLHRDLTPANLMLRGESLVVLDFGLARLVGDSTITKSRGIRMSLAYAPPERFSGQPTTQASDLYQAALVLFELATGRHPYAGMDPSQLATAHLMRPPPKARELAPDLNPLIDRFFDKALRKDPRERYAAAEAMAEDWQFLMA